MGKKTKKPQIRFAGFTDDWEQRKLSEVAERYDNLRIPVSANLRIPGSTPYYGANGIQDYVEGYTHEGEFILVAEDGANDLKNYPVKCVKGRIWVNNHAHVLQGKNEIADNRFLAFAISQADIESLLVGGGRAKLNTETLMGLDLLLPVKQEQVLIGNYFANLDHLITLHQRKLDKLKSVKKSMLEKMIPQNGEVKPEIRFTGFTDDWEQRKLSDIVDVLDGDRGKNYPKETDFDTNGHTLFLNASNVTTDGFSFDTNQFISEEKSDSMGNGKLIDDDIVITSRGSLGHIAWYSADIQRIVPYVRINSGMLILRKKVSINTSYLYQFMKSDKGQNQISFMSFGSAQPQLTKKGIEGLNVNYPKKSKEQAKIGEYFSNLDNLITLHQRKLEKLQNIKKAMLEKMFV